MSIDKHRNPNGTYNGVTAMAELTGIGADEIRAIAEQVKANSAKLNSCPYHDFELIPGSANAAGFKARYRCAHCEGEIDSIAHSWHDLGRRPKPAQRAKPYSFTPVPGATCSRDCAVRHAGLPARRSVSLLPVLRGSAMPYWSRLTRN